ncbi:MAG: ATP-binding cassette domain-containing protein [Theionarchaea archaeon]|nr:ATP-binding cassette domain-containing protein [Theionarchaea archaeon]MBU7000044.1 ATP-binding cassette domain-containing protein [Theionarchaea archaeon]MBU7021658.1 ATP-binding cassette domain-containing protein [Theionarchaea archaeon]MBU7039355.1 ATP-binding cassette domain-containing protein [Theionarchaea archaeon]
MNPIMEIKNLEKYFPITAGFFGRKVGDIRAVDNVSFDVLPKEILGIVGESGCGKTTLGKTILRLIEPTAGEILFEGKDVSTLGTSELKEFRKEAQMIYQDPYSSLDPRMTVYDIIGEPFDIHGELKSGEKKKVILRLMSEVGLAPFHIYRYPHEFSGGQRQRIGIARAIALKPKLIVADEPTSALDVSVQSKILNLLSDIQKEEGLTMLFITHDLSIVRHISDRVAVMYVGVVVEMGKEEQIFEKMYHPYTEALLSAAPIADPRRKRKRIILTGDVPTPANPPKGCRFHPRCRYAKENCATEIPQLRDMGDGHFVACHYPLI